MNLRKTIYKIAIAAMTTFVVGSIVSLRHRTPVEFNVENPTVQDYMANSYSGFGGRTYLEDNTLIANRNAALDNGYRPDQPNVYDVEFSGQGTAVVRLATDKKFKNVVLEKTIDASVGHFGFANLVPGTNYFYVIKAGRKTIDRGEFKAIGQLRMIKVDTGWNIRDLGGWTGWDGHKVRYECIYRGGSLGGDNPGSTNHSSHTYRLSEEDYSELYRIGIRAHLDLRAEPGKGEWNRDKHVNGFSLDKTTLRDALFANIATDYGALHSRVNPSVVGDMAFIIKSLRENRPVYFHCRTGADRTGTVGMAVLGLLGCGETEANANHGNSLVLDYELTSLGMDEDGTMTYNGDSAFRPAYWSVRSMNKAMSGEYDFFRTMFEMSGNSLQEKIYFYLNRYFIDNPVEGNCIGIGKSDLDWFVNYMLGIVDIDGNWVSGQKFVGPSWALDAEAPSLAENIDLAIKYMYKNQ